LSGNNNHLFQTGTNFRPNWIDDHLNGHDGIWCDGTNDFLWFPQSTEIRSVILVMAEDAAASLNYRPLIGDDDKYPCMRGINGELWHPDLADVGVLNGTTRLNSNPVNGITTILPDAPVIVSLRTTAPIEVSQFSKDRSLAGRVWSGHLYEIILSTEELSDEEVANLEQWLADYYSPTILDLGADINITDHFCATELTAQPGFASYTWSTGETGTSISVNSSGEYWVQAIDVFGRQRADTVVVTYPGNIVPPAQNIVCLGDSVLWDTELSNETFSIQWSTGSTAPFVYLQEQGTYTVTVGDAQGCSYTSAAYSLEIDTFAELNALDAAQDLCAGNELSVANLPNVVEAWWNETESTLSLGIETSGTYTVQAINQNGCVLSDTTEVTIVGLAPEIAVVEPPVYCQNAPMEVYASVIADSPIASYTWQLSNGEVYEGANAVFTPASFGNFTLSVTVQTEAGCSNTSSLDRYTHPNPTGNITSSLACSAQAVQFSTVPQIPEGTVFSANWNFGGQSAAGFSASLAAPGVGFHPVSLELMSAAGCFQTINQLVQVYPTPEVQMAAANVCSGSLAEFEGSADVAIAAWYWAFGDNTTSTQQNIAHLYPGSGEFFVTLAATSSAGCVGTTGNTFTVFPNPHADFEVSNACVDTPYPVLESSTSAVDPIVSWEWVVNGAELFAGPDISPVFTQEGFSSIQLTITTLNGCTDEITRQIPVFGLPEVSFVVSPAIGSPPLLVSCNNTSEPGLQFEWDFGNGDVSQDQHPEALFVDEGTYIIQLVGTNSNGCSARAEGSVLATDPITDIQLLNVVTTETSQGTELTLLVRNNGNYTLNKVQGQVEVNKELLFSEAFDVDMQPGEVAEVTFAARLNKWSLTDIVCLQVEVAEALSADEEQKDNIQCKAVEAETRIVSIFPQPLPQGTALTIGVVLEEAEWVDLRVYGA
ncbi:MAG: hypothetical protein RL226_578, partial [Bacteroidota bacterium]